MLDTAVLSIAVPLIVYGLADALLITVPFAGADIVDPGACVSPAATGFSDAAAIAERALAPVHVTVLVEA